MRETWQILAAPDRRSLERVAQSIAWAFVNTLQFLFLAVWSAAWILLALLSLCLTFDRERSLAFARWAWAPALLAVAGAKMDVAGFEKLDKDQAYVFVFNHESLLDTTVAFYSVPFNIRFVAKREVAYLPFIGWYCWAMGFVLVDRKNHERAVASMQAAAKTVREGANVMVFAEGTRSRDGYVHGFKKGAFMLALEAGVPIVPCAISGSRDVLACDGFRVRPGTIRVRAGSPIPTAGLAAREDAAEERDRLIQRTRDAIIDLHVGVGGLGGDKSTALAPPGKPTGRRPA